MVNKAKSEEPSGHKLHLPLYFLSYMITYFFAGAAGFSIMSLYFYFNIYVKIDNNIITWAFLMANPDLLLGFVFLPLFVLAGYFVFLVGSVVALKPYLNYIVKMAPPVEGTFKRSYNNNAKFLSYHNWKTFLIRYIKYKLTRSPFPYLFNWAWNFLDVAKIGKNVVLEDIYHPYEFFEIEDGAYIGPASRLVTQTVEGAHGRLIFNKIHFGKNACMGAFGIMGPGCELGENSTMLPASAAPKAYKMKKENRVYQGVPPIILSAKKASRAFFENPDGYPDFFPKKAKKGDKEKKNKKNVQVSQKQED